MVGALGILGVLSLLASQVLPADVADETGVPAPVLAVLLMVQPALLVVGAAILGDRMVRTTGLRAPYLSRLARVPASPGPPPWTPGSAAIAAVAGALGVGALLAGYGWFTAEQAAMTLTPGTSVSLLTAVLYGGLTEEVLMRWGLMAALLWLLVVMARRRGRRPGVTTRPERPSSAQMTIAVLVTAVVFALLHLPALLTLTEPSMAVIGAAMVANVVAGTVFGGIFAARGLEAAMVAHGGAHLVAAAIGLIV